MVASVTSLTRNGLRDWLIQRVSAVIVAAYSIFLLVFFFTHCPLSFEQWQSLFSNTWMKIASVMTLLALLAHAWIGVWTIATDYIKVIWLRLVFHMMVIILLFAALIWGIIILWGV